MADTAPARRPYKTFSDEKLLELKAVYQRAIENIGHLIPTKGDYYKAEIEQIEAEQWRRAEDRYLEQMTCEEGR